MLNPTFLINKIQWGKGKNVMRFCYLLDNIIVCRQFSAGGKLHEYFHALAPILGAPVERGDRHQAECSRADNLHDLVRGAHPANLGAADLLPDAGNAADQTCISVHKQSGGGEGGGMGGDEGGVAKSTK